MNAELKNKVAELIAMDLFYDEKLERFMELIQQEIAKAFEQGRKVGQYQTAETLYGDVTNIYLFKDGGYDKRPKVEAKR